MALFKLYLKDKSGEISGKLGLFPTQQGRGILNSLLSSTNTICLEGIRFAWEACLMQEAALLPGTAVLAIPHRSEMDASLCLGHGLAGMCP